MKDEIKEIINDLQRVADRKCYPEDILDGSIAQEWVDYITNLQEETERQSKAQVILDDENAELQGKITELQEENERYKNIVDETFNYCKEQQEKSFDVVAEECYAEVMYFISQKKEELKGE